MSTALLQRAIERRANNWESYQEVLTRAEGEERDLSAEERETLDRLDAEITRDSGDIERMERGARLAEQFDTVDRSGLVEEPPAEDRGGNAGGEYRQAFQSFMRSGREDLTVEQRQLLQNGWVSDPEMRAQGTPAAAGGYTIPPEFRNRIVEAMVQFTPMRPLVEVITTDSGANMPWPTNDDTANEGAILAENTQVTEQDLTFGQDEIGAYMYTSRLVRVSFQLLQDSGIDIEAFVGRKLGERIGRVHSRHFTVGTGTGQPQGIVTGAAVGTTAANTGGTTPEPTLSFDNLIDLESSVDAAYRQGDDVGYMLNDTTLGRLRKEKDGNGAYIWQPSTQAGQPSTLLGRPYTINNYMASPANGARSILFGDYRAGYLIRDVRGITLLRLAERYADFLQVGFLAFARADGVVQDTNAYKALEHAV